MVDSRIVVVIALVLTLAVISGAPYDNACTLMPNGVELPDFNEVKNVFTNTDCQNGSIAWNYPRGSLRIHFRYKDQDQEFRVCLKNDVGPRSKAAFDVTGLNAERCTNSVAKEVILELDMPSFQTYVTLYDYRLDFI